MEITWLGQAGFLFEHNGKKILIDPYLSDSVAQKLNPKSTRRQPVDERYLKIVPDVIVITHNHLDHYDPDTLKHYITEESEITVLCPKSVWGDLRKRDKNNYVQFDTGTEFTVCGIRFEAIKAVHSDDFAIGCILDDGEKKYYITGDTLFSKEILGSLPKDIYAVFLPVNGKGNNMNMSDAERFAKASGARFFVPIHFGMFDDLYPQGFGKEFGIIPKIYEKIILER